MMSPKKLIRTNLSVSHDSIGGVFHVEGSQLRGWMCVWHGQLSGRKSIMFLLALSGKVKTDDFIIVSEQRFLLPSNPSCKPEEWFPDAGRDHWVIFVLAYTWIIPVHVAPAILEGCPPLSTSLISFNCPPFVDDQGGTMKLKTLLGFHLFHLCDLSSSRYDWPVHWNDLVSVSEAQLPP